jgi:hypothetical protein
MRRRHASNGNSATRGYRAISTLGVSPPFIASVMRAASVGSPTIDEGEAVDQIAEEQLDVGSASRFGPHESSRLRASAEESPEDAVTAP